jgi:hypothetical protein
MSLTSDSAVKRTGGLMSTRVGDEIYVLNPVRDQYTGLDDIGRRIWDLLEAATRIDSLRDRMVQEYEGDPQQIATEVMEFLNDLHTEGLLEVQ